MENLTNWKEMFLPAQKTINEGSSGQGDHQGKAMVGVNRKAMERGNAEKGIHVVADEAITDHALAHHLWQQELLNQQYHHFEREYMPFEDHEIFGHDLYTETAPQHSGFDDQNPLVDLGHSPIVEAQRQTVAESSGSESDNSGPPGFTKQIHRGLHGSAQQLNQGGSSGSAHHQRFEDPNRSTDPGHNQVEPQTQMISGSSGSESENSGPPGFTKRIHRGSPRSQQQTNQGGSSGSAHHSGVPGGPEEAGTHPHHHQQPHQPRGMHGHHSAPSEKRQKHSEDDQNSKQH
jgi:hypothetical protein